MNKKLIALAVAGVVSAYGTAASAVEVSGFANIKYTITNDSAVKNEGTPTEYNSKEDKFAVDGEIDVISTVGAVTTRIDVDLNVTGNGDSGTLEQAMFAWDLDAVTLIGGVFNNPIGYEAEDVPDITFNTHGAVYTALDSQTARDGDNVTGLAVAGALGPVTLTGAFLNDLQDVNEENSIAFIANYSPIAGLDLELGLATQAGNAGLGATAGLNTSVGDITNFNVVYTGVKNLTLGLDYLAGDVVLDSAYDLWAGYYFGGGFSVNARLSEVEYNSSDVTTLVAGLGGAVVSDALKAVGLPAGNSETTTLNLTYKVSKNLKAALEFSSTDVTLLSNPTTSDDLTTLKLLATF